MASNCVGLDIGSSPIKKLQGQGSAKAIPPLDFCIEPPPPPTSVDGAIMDQAAVVDAIRRLRATLGIRNKQVATAISGHSVIIKKIQVPQMAPEELGQQLQIEAEQHIPFRADEVEMDHQLVNPRNAQGM